MNLSTHLSDESLVLPSAEQPPDDLDGRRQPGQHPGGLLADRFGLRTGLRREDATDLLLMLSSAETYLTLQRYGWSGEKYVEWLTDTLAGQLLAQPGRRGKER